MDEQASGDRRAASRLRPVVAWLARVSLAGFAVGAGAVLVSFYLALMAPVVPEVEPPPKPNGYDELLRIGTRFNWSAIPSQDVDAATPAECQAFAAANAQELAAVRAALKKPRRYPLVYTIAGWSKNIPILSTARVLARGMRADGKAAATSGKHRQAADRAVDTIRMADAISRGGLYVDDMVGNAVEGLAIGSLAKELPVFNAADLKYLVENLEQLDTAHEPVALVIGRERIFSSSALGWIGRAIMWADTILFVPTERAVVNVRRRGEAHLRLVLAEAAVRRCRLETGPLPASLDALVPKYLSAVPIDPYSERPLIYRRTEEGYLLYSVGGNGVDDGGQRTDFIDATTSSGDLFFDAPETNDEPAASPAATAASNDGTKADDDKPRE